MKTFNQVISLLIALACLGSAAAQTNSSPSPPPAPAETKPAEAKPADQTAPAAAKSSAPTNSPEAKPAEAISTPTPQPAPAAGANEKGLRMNFRGVPIDMVLNHLSTAAGFVIVLDPKVQGKMDFKVDVWSNQPLSQQETLELLNKVLNQNGYAAIRNERTLTIVTRDDARTRDIPVKAGNNPANIPRTDEMVTQIVPVQYANAAQLVQNLTPLLPDYAKLTSNESGNALVITATQADVKRMAEIVKALDTSISSTSSIKVFPLRFADAKELANSIKELFTPPPTQPNNGRGGGLFNQFFAGRGGGGFGGRGGGGGGAPGGGGGGGGGANTRVVAVPDERTNSLIVSAPEDMMATIEKIVEEIDVNSSDITELRVFHLVNSDPVEMSDMLAQLFPDQSRSTDNNNLGFRFNRGGFGGGFPGFGGPGRGNAANQGESDRLKKKGQVLAVPDQRTSSIIVSADSTLMPQIAEMIQQLDASNARKQRVYVYSLQNADPQEVAEVLQEMFQRNTTAQRRNQNQNSPLMNRQQQNNQNIGNQNNSGFGTSGGNRRNSGGGGFQ